MSKSVLVIDDDEAVRKSISSAIEAPKYQVHTAKSGEQGIRMEQKTKYDLIFLDLRMPGLNGVETLRKLRKLDPGVPIYIIITAFHKEFLNQLGGAAASGLNFEVLNKSVGNEQLVLLTESVLEGPMGFRQQ